MIGVGAIHAASRYIDRKERKIKSDIRKKNTYTKAPPALPNLVILPFPKELFMAFIDASIAFCWK